MSSKGHRTVASFCERYGIRAPILLAPMAGACPPALSVEVIQSGGFGACGAFFMTPDAITEWATEVRARSADRFQINLWIPDPAPHRDRVAEAATRRFLSTWGPEVAPEAGDFAPPDFDAQLHAIVGLRPKVMSSIMGLYPPHIVHQLHAADIAWFATATTVAEAVAAEAAGADAIIAQGMEAGGHRGCFVDELAERQLVGLFALVPAIVDAVDLPVIAAGGIADSRGVAAALALGASAVQIGTAFLRTPEARLHPVWADAIGRTLPEGTTITRAFSGRAGRSISTAYTIAAALADSPPPAPHPVQRGLTQAMRDQGTRTNNLDLMQIWAGQSAALAQAKPAAAIVAELWDETKRQGDTPLQG